MKINIDSFNIAATFAELGDNQRLELIKQLILDAPDIYDFVKKLKKKLSSNKFLASLD